MLHPFKAVRPTRDKAYLVATRSYISYSEEHLADKLDHNPYTFLHVINPQALPEESAEIRHRAVRDRFNVFLDEGIFERDGQSHYYLYKQVTPTQSFVGVIGLLDAFASTDGRVLPHEQTIEQRELLFAHYLEHVGFQAEPVLVFGPSNELYERIVGEVMRERPEYEFASTDRFGHYLWLIPPHYNPDLEAFFKREQRVYVADGHHRLASSIRMAQMHPENRDAQGIMCMFMAEHQVGLETFERWLRWEGDIAWDTIDTHFVRTPIARADTCHFGPYLIEMFAEGQWFGLQLKQPSERELLSTQVLYDFLLKPVFQIKDERSDPRLTYVRQEPLDRSTEMQHNGYTIGFRVLPPSVELLRGIAENKGSMPPKSTYIEPKLRSGMLIHTFL